MLPIRDERSLISIFSHDDGIIHGGLLHESETPKSTSTPLFISGFFPPEFHEAFKYFSRKAIDPGTVIASCNLRVVFVSIVALWQLHARTTTGIYSFRAPI